MKIRAHRASQLGSKSALHTIEISRCGSDSVWHLKSFAAIGVSRVGQILRISIPASAVYEDSTEFMMYCLVSSSQ